MDFTEINEKLDLLLSATSRPVMTMRQAAVYLNISYDSVARLARIGQIKTKKIGTKRIVKKEWLDEWMES